MLAKQSRQKMEEQAIHPQTTKPQRSPLLRLGFPMNRLLYLIAVLGLLLSFQTVGCFATVKTSKDLACKTDSDCWDGLPCVRLICGAEPKAEAPPKPRPEPVVDAGPTETSAPDEQSQPEPSPDIVCPVPNGSIELCKDNSFCLSGLCESFSIPGCAKDSKACTCKTVADCKGTEKCCSSGNVSICSPFPCTPP